MSETDVVAESGAAPTAVASVPGLAGALLRYRILAYIVGIGTVIVYYGFALLLATGSHAFDAVGMPHGILFILYLIAAFDLCRRVGWDLKRVALIAIVGLIPFVTFIAEYKVTRAIRARAASR